MEFLVFAMWLLLLFKNINICASNYQYGNEHCTDKQFPTDISANETTVEIRYCPMDEIPAGALDHLSALETFLMSHVPTLHTFPNVTAVGNTLKTLNLWENAIGYINPDFLNALVVLKTLNLVGNNVLDHIPDVPSLQSLQQLYIARNSFSRMPCRVHCQSLNNLDISSNPIESVQEDLANTPAIKMLLMKDTNLKELPDLVSLPLLWHLRLGGPSLELMAAHNTAVLGRIRELDLQGSVQLEFLPTLCTKQPQSLSVELSDSGLKMCHCHHAWLKAAADAGATVNTAAVCGGHDWRNLTTTQFLDLCDQHDDQRSLSATVTRRAAPLLCAFPRQSVQSDTSLSDCILQCMNTKGCLSVNFRPTVSDAVGECVLLAPTADGGHVQAVEEEGWMLHGLVFSDMI